MIHNFQHSRARFPTMKDNGKWTSAVFAADADLKFLISNLNLHIKFTRGPDWAPVFDWSHPSWILSAAHMCCTLFIRPTRLEECSWYECLIFAHGFYWRNSGPQTFKCTAVNSAVPGCSLFPPKTLRMSEHSTPEHVFDLWFKVRRLDPVFKQMCVNILSGECVSVIQGLIFTLLSLTTKIFFLLILTKSVGLCTFVEHFEQTMLH